MKSLPIDKNQADMDLKFKIKKILMPLILLFPNLIYGNVSVHGERDDRSSCGIDVRNCPALLPKPIDLSESESFIWPARGVFTSGFGKRKDPLYPNVESFHNGIDIANNPGTTIVAAMSGKVTEIGKDRVYGRYIIIKHQRGYQTMYAHLSHEYTRPNVRVYQGERIGLMGSTGYSTGSHLHFSISKNNEYVDPMDYLE